MSASSVRGLGRSGVPFLKSESGASNSQMRQKYSRFAKIPCQIDVWTIDEVYAAEQVSTCLLSSSLRSENPSAKDGFWDHVFWRNVDKRGNGSRRCLDDRNSRRRQSSVRNCRGLRTFAAAACPASDRCSGRWLLVSLLFDGGVCASLALVCLEGFLAQAQRFRSYFDELIVRDEFDSLLQIQRPERD